MAYHCHSLPSALLTVAVRLACAIVVCIATSACGAGVISRPYRDFMDPHHPPLAASSRAFRRRYLDTSKTHILWHHSSLQVCRMPLDCTIDLSYLLCRYRTRDCTQASKTSTTLRPVHQGPTLGTLQKMAEQRPPRYLPRDFYDAGWLAQDPPRERLLQPAPAMGIR